MPAMNGAVVRPTMTKQLVADLEIALRIAELPVSHAKPVHRDVGGSLGADGIRDGEYETGDADAHDGYESV